MVAAFSFGPLGAMTDLVVAPGVGVESGRGRSEFVSGAGVRWARQGASNPRTWRMSRPWQDPSFARMLDLAAHSPSTPFYLYDTACARRNLLPAKDCFGIPATRTNLCVNPGWESGLTQFGAAPGVATGVTAALATDWFNAGAQSAKFTFTGTANAYPFGAFAGTMARAGLIPGRTYTFAATLRFEPTGTLAPGQVPDQPNVAVAFMASTPGAGSQKVFSLGPSVPMRSWLGRLVFQFTVPDDATEAAVALSTSMYTSMRAGTLWVDSITLEEGVTSGAYFDGATAGYAWSGTANASSTVPSVVPVAGMPMPPVSWTKATAFVLAGRTYTLSAWTTGTTAPLNFQEAGNTLYAMPAPVNGLSQVTFTPTVSRVLTLTRPTGRVVSGVRLHEGVPDGLFYPSEGTPTRVAVTDPGRTYQLVTSTQTLTDYDVELKEIGVQGKF